MVTVMSPRPGPNDYARRIFDHQAPVYNFSFTPYLAQTYRHGLSPERPHCKAYLQGHCPMGSACLDKHTNSSSNYSNLVCKHWLRGLCKKGETCEFLHEYNLRKMPECQFFQQQGFCLNKDECLYLHYDDYDKAHTLTPCPHYEKGFCVLGPRCSKKHVRKVMCEFYLAGFCPDGKVCKKAHPRWAKDLPTPMVKVERTQEEIAKEQDRLREKWEGEQAEKERDGRFGSMDGGRGGRGRWRGRGQGQGRGRGRGHY